MKQNAKEIKIKNVENQIVIAPAEGDAILKMKRSNRIASDFLSLFRNAFAHNYISYEAEAKQLTVDLKTKDGTELLAGRITLSAFEDIVKCIKESRGNHKNSVK